MSLDLTDYRKALGTFPTGVAVITTNDPSGRAVGLTCNSFSSVSLTPPLVLWSLRTESKLLSIFRGAGKFAINVLREDQHDISTNFSRSHDKRLDDLEIIAGELPAVRDCVARFKCDTVSEYLEGDHVIFVGRVIAFDYLEASDSLVFYRGAYKAIAESIDRKAFGAKDFDEARRHIYTLLAQIASARASKADLEALEQAIEEISSLERLGRMRERAYRALEFFHLIARAAHSPVLSTMVKTIEDISKDVVTERAKHMKWEEMRNPDLQDIRVGIVRAIAAGDESQVTQKMNDYFRHSPMLLWQDKACEARRADRQAATGAPRS